MKMLDPRGFEVIGFLTICPSGKRWTCEGGGLVGKWLRSSGIFQIRRKDGRIIPRSSLITVEILKPWIDMKYGEVTRWLTRVRHVDPQTIEVDTLRWCRGKLTCQRGAGFKVSILAVNNDASRARGRLG